MDAATSHDPFAPETAKPVAEFPAARLRRGGASDDELDALEAAYLAESHPAQLSLLHWLASVGDGEITDQLDTMRAQEWFDVEGTHPIPSVKLAPAEATGLKPPTKEQIEADRAANVHDSTALTDGQVRDSLGTGLKPPTAEQIAADRKADAAS